MNRRGFFAAIAGGIVGLGLGLKGYAQGGEIKSPQRYGVIGERGPELFIPASDPRYTKFVHIGAGGGGSGRSMAIGGDYHIGYGAGGGHGCGGGGGGSWLS